MNTRSADGERSFFEEQKKLFKQQQEQQKTEMDKRRVQEGGMSLEKFVAQAANTNPIFRAAVQSPFCREVLQNSVNVDRVQKSIQTTGNDFNLSFGNMYDFLNLMPKEEREYVQRTYNKDLPEKDKIDLTEKSPLSPRYLMHSDESRVGLINPNRLKLLKGAEMQKIIGIITDCVLRNPNVDFTIKKSLGDALEGINAAEPNNKQKSQMLKEAALTRQITNTNKGSLFTAFFMIVCVFLVATAVVVGVNFLNSATATTHNKLEQLNDIPGQKELTNSSDIGFSSSPNNFGDHLLKPGDATHPGVATRTPTAMTSTVSTGTTQDTPGLIGAAFAGAAALFAGALGLLKFLSIGKKQKKLKNESVFNKIDKLQEVFKDIVETKSLPIPSTRSEIANLPEFLIGGNNNIEVQNILITIIEKKFDEMLSSTDEANKRDLKNLFTDFTAEQTEFIVRALYEKYPSNDNVIAFTDNLANFSNLKYQVGMSQSVQKQIIDGIIDKKAVNAEDIWNNSDLKQTLKQMIDTNTLTDQNVQEGQPYNFMFHLFHAYNQVQGQDSSINFDNMVDTNAQSSSLISGPQAQNTSTQQTQQQPSLTSPKTSMTK